MPESLTPEQAVELQEKLRAYLAAQNHESTAREALVDALPERAVVYHDVAGQEPPSPGEARIVWTYEKRDGGLMTGVSALVFLPPPPEIRDA